MTYIPFAKGIQTDFLYLRQADGSTESAEVCGAKAAVCTSTRFQADPEDFLPELAGPDRKCQRIIVETQRGSCTIIDCMGRLRL